MFTSIEILKSVGCKRISHLIWRNSIRDYSLFKGKKTIESRSLNYHSQNCHIALKCQHMVAITSALSTLSNHRYAFTVNVMGKFFIHDRHYQTKSKDFNKEDDDDSDVENKAKNVLDDLEFQSLLKDFAQDFGVNDETSKFLEEIKERHHSPFEDKTEQSPSRAACCDNQLDIKNDTELRTDSLPSHEHEIQELCGRDSSAVPHFEETLDDSADETFFHIDQELEKSVEYDAERGKTGVFDIDELVVIAKEENLVDITVIQVPQSFHYTDYLVLTTAKSPRHCHAVMEFIIKCYKKKKNIEDSFVKLEGKNTATWKALDMGNIVLHVFLQETRDFYDIESLWLLDKKYDRNDSVKSDPEMNMLQQHLDFLNTLTPH